MGLLDARTVAPRDPQEADAYARRQLDALIVKQMLQSSGAFKSSPSAGSSLHADLFVDALADAISRGGDLGFAQAALPARAQAQAATPFTSPLPAGEARLTSGFGLRADPLDGHAADHAGVDLGAKEGTPVLAAAAGTVRRAGARGGYGDAVELDHGNGLTTLYAHASALLVREGDRVERGQAVALVGSSGRATGAHLHFEVRQGGHAVNPGSALKAYAKGADEQVEGKSSRRGRGP